MHPQLWQRVRKIFEQALELPPERWREFLEGACAGDPTLQTEVRLLLDADAAALVADGVIDVAAEGLPIGRWCEQRKIGINERIRLFLRICEPVSWRRPSQRVARGTQEM